MIAALVAFAAVCIGLGLFAGVVAFLEFRADKARRAVYSDDWEGFR